MARNRPWLDLYPDHINKEISVSDISMVGVLERTVKKFPNHLAISFHDQNWTYAELKEQVDLFAAALQSKGIKKGDPIALMLPTCPQYVVAYYGILLIGGMVVPINPQSTKRELKYILNDTKAKTIITLDDIKLTAVAAQASTSLEKIIVTSLHSEVSHNLAQGLMSFDSLMRLSTGKVARVDIEPAQDIGVILYTGGTTGRPKGVMLTHQNLVANIEQHDELYKDKLIHGEERVLIVLPLFHSYGMTIGMNLSVLQGSCLILLEKFELKAVLETIKKEKPTRFAGVPTMYSAINNYPLSECGTIRNKFFKNIPLWWRAIAC